MVDLKICQICKLSKESKNFLSNSSECVKCVYKKKLSTISEHNSSKNCLICGKCLPQGRWKYCTLECAGTGKKNRRHWTTQCKNDSTGYKARFNFYV